MTKKVTRGPTDIEPVTLACSPCVNTRWSAVKFQRLEGKEPRVIKTVSWHEFHELDEILFLIRVIREIRGKKISLLRRLASGDGNLASARQFRDNLSFT